MSQKNKSRGTSIKDKYKSLPVNFDFDDLAFIDAGDGELPTNINAINEAQFYLFDKTSTSSSSTDNSLPKNEDTNVDLNSKKDRKQLKFNLTDDLDGLMNSGNLLSNSDTVNKDSVLPVLDILYKMKKDAKINNVSQESLHRKEKKKKNPCLPGLSKDSICSPKIIKEYIFSMRSNLYYFLERPVGLIGLFYRLFTFTIIIGNSFFN